MKEPTLLERVIIALSLIALIVFFAWVLTPRPVPLP